MKQLSPEGAESATTNVATNEIPVELFDAIKEHEPELAAVIEDYIKSHGLLYTVYAGWYFKKSLWDKSVIEDRVGIFAEDVLEDRYGGSLLGWLSFPVPSSIKSSLPKVYTMPSGIGLDYCRA